MVTIFGVPALLRTRSRTVTVPAYPLGGVTVKDESSLLKVTFTGEASVVSPWTVSPGVTNLATLKVVDRSFDTVTSVCIVAIDEVKEAVLSVDVPRMLLLEYKNDVVLIDRLVPVEAEIVDDKDTLGPLLLLKYENDVVLIDKLVPVEAEIEVDKDTLGPDTEYVLVEGPEIDLED